tara:strand:+ start:8944 stop:9162 length:219 start_codon:yes stop_codon:yes gene_type:complete
MIGLIITIIVLAIAFTYVTLLYFGKVEDDNKNFIPDSVEDVVDEVEDRLEALSDEIADAIDAVKGKKNKKKK